MAEPSTDELMRMDCAELEDVDASVLARFACELKKNLSTVRNEYETLYRDHASLREQVQSLLDRAERLSRRRNDAPPSPQRSGPREPKVTLPEIQKQLGVNARKELEQATAALTQLESFMAFRDVSGFQRATLKEDSRTFLKASGIISKCDDRAVRAFKDKLCTVTEKTEILTALQANAVDAMEAHLVALRIEIVEDDADENILKLNFTDVPECERVAAAMSTLAALATFYGDVAPNVTYVHGETKEERESKKQRIEEEMVELQKEAAASASVQAPPK